MKITVCGSMSFAVEMLQAKQLLEQGGHVCFLPSGVEEYAQNKVVKIGGSEGAKRKIQHDFINKHYREIEKSDAILILNYDKKGIKNYIGGNSFLEMGFAHVLGKKIFLLNDIPDLELIKQEIEAMLPIVLNGDFGKLE